MSSSSAGSQASLGLVAEERGDAGLCSGVSLEFRLVSEAQSYARRREPCPF